MRICFFAKIFIPPYELNEHFQLVKTNPSAKNFDDFDNFDDFCILDKANNNFDLLIHESLLILRDRPTLNQQNSSIPLYLF